MAKGAVLNQNDLNEIMEFVNEHLVKKKITIDDKDSMVVVEKLLKEFKESIQKIEKKFAEDAVKIKISLFDGTSKRFNVT